MKNAADISMALAYVDKAMERAEAIAAKAAAEHLQAFEMQMREKLGVSEIALNEPYLPQWLARFQSEYLGRMENIKRAIVSAKSSKADYIEHKDLDTDKPLMSRVELFVDMETNRFNLEAKQNLDSIRQQAFGITHYIWEGGDCSLCSPNNGQIFEWGEGDEPGSIHPNCNCSADPILEDAGDSKETTKPIVTDSGKDVIIQHSSGSKEVRSGGTRAWRNNNPGNIRSGKFADRYGAIGSAGGFAVFPDEKTGKAASEALLKTSVYSKLTINEAIARRSPSNENNTIKLQSDIHKIGGFQGNEVIEDLNSEQMSRLVEAIQRTEGWKEGTVSEEP